MSIFKEYTVNDVINLVIDYRGKTPKKLDGDWSESGYRALSAKNVKTGKIVQPDTIRYVSEEMYNKWMKDEVERGDIFVTSEAPFGQIYFWDSDEKIVLSQRLFAIRSKKEFYDKYIYFYMTTPKFQAELENRSTGTTVTGLRQPELLKSKIIAPDYNTQVKIADFLYAIEKKININEAINRNLEEQCFVVFHELFDEEIKEDTYVQFCEYATFKYGTMPKKDKIVDEGYPIFSGYQIVGRYPEKMFDEPQLIIVVRGVGGTGDVKYSPANCYLTNLAIAIVVNDKDYEDYLYHYLMCHDMKVLNTGSAQPQITISSLEKYKLYFPEKNKAKDFSRMIKPFIGEMRMMQQENERLNLLRDTLLPKLMSGELDVSDLDI